MQVTFAGHPYLFVNPKFAGKYLPPTPGKWFNYGGDKLWLLPEGNDDEQHWAGDSDVLDDGPFTFRKLSEGQTLRDRTHGPGRSPDRDSVCSHDSSGRRLPAHQLSRLDEECDRAYAGMVDAVGLAIRYWRSRFVQARSSSPEQNQLLRRASTTISGRLLRRTHRAVISTAIMFASARRKILRYR